MGAYETKAWLTHYPEWTDPNPIVGSDTLVSLFNTATTTHPDRIATWFMGKTLTYQALNEQVNRLAAGLQRLGVTPGDRVVIALPNCPQHVIAITAILRIGAVAIEHNPLYTAYELEKQFLDHGARVAIVFDREADTFHTLQQTTALETVIAVNLIDAMPRHLQLALQVPLGSVRAQREELHKPAPNAIAWESLVAKSAAPTDLPAITQSDTAFILYTSGTTGTPKGVPLTHANVLSVLAAGAQWVKDWGAVSEKVLAILPMFHIYGLALNYGFPLTVAGQIVLVPAPKPKLYQQAILKTRPTLLPGVPLLYERIAQWAVEKNVDLSSFHSAISGAATLPQNTIELWERVTGGQLIEGYGLTETSPILCGNPLDGNRRPGYIGVPFPNTDIRIANPDNPGETMPDGEPGELLARGPQVFSGYLNNPEATEQAFHDGWFRTGDMAVMEPDGFIRLVARIKEIIITGGFNVYPDEVEEAVRTHPDVEDVAVVGLPRDDGSEDVVACVTLRDGAPLDPDGLKEHARQRLTRYKVPRTFYHFEDLNRDQTGKIRRRAVQQELVAMLQSTQ